VTYRCHDGNVKKPKIIQHQKVLLTAAKQHDANNNFANLVDDIVCICRVIIFVTLELHCNEMPGDLKNAVGRLLSFADQKIVQPSIGTKVRGVSPGAPS
jgi:hypothetical protein